MSVFPKLLLIILIATSIPSLTTQSDLNQFNQLSCEPLQLSMEYLTFKEQTTVSYTNQRFHHCYRKINGEILTDMHTLHNFTLDINKSIINEEHVKEIKCIYNKHKFDELYLLTIPKIMDYCIKHIISASNSNNTHTNVTWNCGCLMMLLNFPNVFSNKTKFDQLDDVTKVLIQTSHYIGFGKGLQGIKSEHDDCLRLLYEICFLYINSVNSSNSSLLPKIDFYNHHLNDINKLYLSELIDAGFVPWHKQFIQKKWKSNNLTEYIIFYVSEILPILTYHNIDDPLIDIYEWHFLLKLLENGHFDLRQHFILKNGSYSDVFSEFAEIVQHAINISFHNEHDELCEELVCSLRDNNGLWILNHNQFLQELHDTNDDYYTFIKLLFQISMNCSISTIIHDRSVIIAYSAYLYFEENEQIEAELEITKLAEDRLFDNDLLDDLIVFYNTYHLFEWKEQQKYRRIIIHKLCELRNDWSLLDV